ncbi:MAG TPA: hypothetical protein VJ782_02205 [Aeromicrobium sp.]|nr:hypothetical protein [Aeromicrobium sp.]
MSEWKPGDVAATEYNGVRSRALVVKGGWLCPAGHDRGPHWHAVGGGWHPLDDDAVTFRRLAVIDPEDRQQVERLGLAYLDMATTRGGPDRDAFDIPETVEQMQAALREYATPTPPKPEEPTALGAVVVDSHEVEYVHLGSGLWTYGTTDGPAGSFAWPNVDAVRVLSPGVEVDQ